MAYSTALASFDAGNICMTSREIADATGKRHANVIRDIRNMLTKLGADSTQFWVEYQDSTGRRLPEARLPKRECLILASGYSVELRAKIIDRWAVLEAAAQSPSPTTALALPADYLSALKQLVASEEAKLALQAENQKLLPAKAVVDRIAMAEGCHDWLSASKVLGYGRTTLLERLREMQVINGANLPYQQHIVAGRFKVVETTWRSDDGISHVHAKTTVTPKGMLWLAQLLQEVTYANHF